MSTHASDQPSPPSEDNRQLDHKIILEVCEYLTRICRAYDSNLDADKTTNAIRWSHIMEEGSDDDEIDERMCQDIDLNHVFAVNTDQPGDAATSRVPLLARDMLDAVLREYAQRLFFYKEGRKVLRQIMSLKSEVESHIAREDELSEDELSEDDLSEDQRSEDEL